MREVLNKQIRQEVTSKKQELSVAAGVGFQLFSVDRGSGSGGSDTLPEETKRRPCPWGTGAPGVFYGTNG